MPSPGPPRRSRLAPLSPADCDRFAVHSRTHEPVPHIRVKNRGGGGNKVIRVTCDGVERPDRTIPLLSDRVEHYAVVEIGG